MTTTTTKRTAGTAQALPLLLASCMSVLGSVLLAPVIPQLLQQFGASGPGLVLLIISAPALMIAVFAPFAGQFADRVGRKNLLIVSMVLYAIVGTAPVWLPADLSLILASRLLVGVCEAAIMTCCTTLLADYFSGERRNKYFGLQTVFTTISAVVFILLGGILGGAGGWRTPFFVYAIALIIVIPMFFVIWEPKKTDAEKAAAAAQAKARIPWNLLGRPLLVTLFGGFAFFVVLAVSAVIYASLGLIDSQSIGLISAAAALATALFAFLFARLAKFGAKVLLSSSFGAMALGYVIVWISGNAGALPGVFTGVIVASAGAGLLLPTLLSWSLGRIPFESRGRSSGIWTAVFFFGQFISPIVIGIITGALTVTEAVAVGIVGVACAVVAVILAVTVAPGPIIAESVGDDKVVAA